MPSIANRIPWQPPQTWVEKPATETLTPHDVDAVQFTIVRNLITGRVGYDEIEVDEFLDRVANTIARQARLIDQLQQGQS